MKLIDYIKSSLFLIAAITLIASCGEMLADKEKPEDILNEYGHSYQVYAGNAPLFDCLDPSTSGFMPLGSSYHSEYFFSAIAFDTYVILTEPGNFAFVDAVQDDSNNFQPASWSCNTFDEWNLGDNSSELDRNFAWVGTEHSRGQRGALVISMPASNSIFVHIVEEAYYFDD